MSDHNGLSAQQRRAAFLRDYGALCEKYGVKFISALAVAQNGDQQLIDPVLADIDGWEAPAEDEKDDTEAD